MGNRQKFLTGFAILLLMASAFAWLSYVAQAIGYSAMPPSIQQNNSSVKLHVLIAFWIALGFECFAVGLLSWLRVLTTNRIWLRLGSAVTIGLMADFFTYAFIRSI